MDVWRDSSRWRTQGLTWGEDRVLYVGNTMVNGDFNTADLEAETCDVLFQFEDRISARSEHLRKHLDEGHTLSNIIL